MGRVPCWSWEPHTPPPSPSPLMGKPRRGCLRQIAASHAPSLRQTPSGACPSAGGGAASPMLGRRLQVFGAAPVRWLLAVPSLSISALRAGAPAPGLRPLAAGPPPLLPFSLYPRPQWGPLALRCRLARCRALLRLRPRFGAPAPPLLRPLRFAPAPLPRGPLPPLPSPSGAPFVRLRFASPLSLRAYAGGLLSLSLLFNSLRGHRGVGLCCFRFAQCITTPSPRCPLRSEVAIGVQRAFVVIGWPSTLHEGNGISNTQVCSPKRANLRCSFTNLYNSTNGAT